MGVLGAGQAQALVVTVNGQQWNITTTTRTRAQLFSAGGSLGLSSGQPWGGSTTIATQFSNALQSALGIGYNSDTNGVYEQGLPSTGGPLFATLVLIGSNYDLTTDDTYSTRVFRGCYWTGSSTACPNQTFSGQANPASGIFQLTDASPNLSDTFAFTFAQADLVPPVPGPLPALGAAAAFGFSRKLRNRIKNIKAVGASITAA